MDPLSNQTDDQIPLPEACNRLRLSRHQVIRRINKEELVGGQYMGRWFVTLESIKRYLAEQQTADA